jgi:hypothetical protein
VPTFGLLDLACSGNSAILSVDADGEVIPL